MAWGVNAWGNFANREEEKVSSASALNSMKALTLCKQYHIALSKFFLSNFMCTGKTGHVSFLFVQLSSFWEVTALMSVYFKASVFTTKPCIDAILSFYIKTRLDGGDNSFMENFTSLRSLCTRILIFWTTWIRLSKSLSIVYMFW